VLSDRENKEKSGNLVEREKSGNLICGQGKADFYALFVVNSSQAKK